MRIARLATLCLVGALAPLAGSAEVPEAKRALVIELIELSAGSEVGAQAVDEFLRRIEPEFPALVKSLVASEEDLDPADRPAVEARLSDFAAFRADFEQRFPEEVDLEAVLAEVYVPLYDRYFEEEELAEIVAFYRSPAGRKMMRVMPLVLQEGMSGTLERIQPEFLRVVALVLAQRREELSAEGDVR